MPASSQESPTTAGPVPETPVQATAAAFVRAHQAGLWRFLRAAGCDAALAEELTQDALLVALRREVVDRDRAVAAAFLRTTARNLWLRRQRDDRRHNERVVDAVEQLWQADAAHDDGGELLQALDRCLATLPERSRSVLQRFYGEGASRRELASELGLSEHGVRTLLQRVRAALRDCIERRLA